MEKIEYLAGYLPFKLKMQYIGQGRPFRGTKKVEELNIQNIELLMFSNHRKPILRPLSDTTKEIEVNGVKFVPIIKLTKIAHGYRFIEHVIVSDNFMNVDYFKYGEHFKFSISQGLKFINIYNNSENKYIPISNLSKLLQKLHEWHFDIYGLIEKGLAIDINTLK